MGTDIAVAGIAGRFRPVGSLHIGRRLRHELDALRFNPCNTGGGKEPAGSLNGLSIIGHGFQQK